MAVLFDKIDYPDHVNDHFLDPLDPITAPPPSHRRKFVLCFDGTGNKFSGTDADSNILKIYRMLDRTDHTQFHYYQPGIGTYVTTHSLSSTGHLTRLRSWYMKGKDSMFGTSLAEHVMGGYKFLMRYYRVGDEIYLFGFSRGAYTARFLAEMIDHIGLLGQGNEELIQFAWKTFQKWQCRVEDTNKEKEEKNTLLKFMCAFRETFSRPVKPIRFLGLFDTVNSVPRFENALMSRTKFPYTARSSARVIRHAVSIGERRAKFRQDLIGERRRVDHKPKYRATKVVGHARPSSQDGTRLTVGATSREDPERGRRATLQVPLQFREGSETVGVRSLSPNLSIRSNIIGSDTASVLPFKVEEDEGEQDIQEVWFSGAHADIGGGWPLEEGEEVALSHIPLVWMVREAQRAGLRFDETKLRNLHCSPDEHDQGGAAHKRIIPAIVEPTDIPEESEEPEDPEEKKHVNGIDKVSDEPAPDKEEMVFKDDDVALDDLPIFHRKLRLSGNHGKVHDVLRFKNGVNGLGVLAWNFMEYLPFRRMDLQPDGSWKPIVFPLPKGEVRDIPDNAVIHNSVIKRMLADPTYRPGNVIIGGGGRGVLVAPKEFGIGKWKVLREEDDWVGEVYVRAEKPKPPPARTNSIGNMKKLLGERKKTQ